MFNYFRKKRQQSAWAQNNRQRKFVDFTKVNSVLILFDYDDLSLVMPVARDLVKLKKKVYLWTTTKVKGHSDKIYDSSGQSVRVVTPEDQSRLFILSRTVLKEFKTLQCDMLVDMIRSDDEVLYYLLLNNRSKFCVGLKERDIKVYDFIYLKTDEQSFADAFEDIKNYMNIYVPGNK